jgi:glycosyltransferase involved in cell wall biosynthesis
MSAAADAERVALVVTVLNEGETIDALLTSVAAQTRLPDEVHLVDGGSSDDTAARARAWVERGLPLTVTVRPGANISVGRNAAIAATRAPLLAVTDAGVELASDWLERLTAPFADPTVDLVAGFFRAAPRTPFEAALGATTLPSEDDVEPGAFLPSSRSVAFRRAAWKRVGGYPEWLDYCEDVVFDLALRHAGRAPRRVPSSASTSCTHGATARPTCGGGATPSAMARTWACCRCCWPYGSGEPWRCPPCFWLAPMCGAPTSGSGSSPRDGRPPDG